MNIKVGEIEKVFNDIFGDSHIKNVDTVYEKSDDNKFYKLVISINNLSYKDIVLLHTKFIFNVDINKEYLVNNTYKYLYDINCQYKMVSFDTILKLEDSIKNILDNTTFGNDLKIISDFLTSPVVFLNYYLNREKIDSFNVFDFQYEPNYEIVPCNEVIFLFKVNLSNKYNIDINFKKKSNNEYVFITKGVDIELMNEMNDITSFSFVIGSLIIDHVNKVELDK